MKLPKIEPLEWNKSHEKQTIEEKQEIILPKIEPLFIEKFDHPEKLDKSRKQILNDEEFHSVKVLNQENAQDTVNSNTSWDKRIRELEFSFENQTIPNEAIRLNGHELITDVAKFIESSMQTIIAKNGNPYFLPYLHRLELLKQILSNKS